MIVSDTHNTIPSLPKGDVLIHSGDLTNQGTYGELRKAVKWIEAADFEAKMVIAGNHDITLDAAFYSQHGQYFHNQDLQDPQKCQELLKCAISITYLNHESAEIKLQSPEGPRTCFTIFGSPFSPAKGLWAFGYTPEEAPNLWQKIPLDTDIIVTHTPAKYHCDETKERRAAGCEGLRQELWRIRPRLAICGHVHEARGAEIVRWGLLQSNLKYKEDGTDRWVDPSTDSKKMSLIDLTLKGGSNFKNDGSKSDGLPEDFNPTSPTRITTSAIPISQAPFQTTHPKELPKGAKGKRRNFYSQESRVSSTDAPEVFKQHLPLVIPKETSYSSATGNSTSLPPATRGQGGVPPSYRADLEALAGRMGRRETCIVNAAIMASSWPHKKGGARKMNKPIVVDIELPVWEDK